MNQQINFIFGLLLACIAGIAGAADKQVTQPSAPVVATKATNNQVIAYYFHGTVRCETCQRIEEQVFAALRRRFESELAAKRLIFVSLNYDKPENKSYQEKYKLPCPSLVIVQRKDGKDEKWKLLEDTWKLIDEPLEFNKYVEDEVEKLLSDIKQISSPNFSF